MRNQIHTTEAICLEKPICIGCGKEKAIGLVVCWDCFKCHTTPLKYFEGDINEWLKAIGRAVGSGAYNWLK